MKRPRLILVSQNLLKYNIDIPLDAILRINLAWIKDLDSASELLEEYQGYEIFLDVPIGRKKPPNFEHCYAGIIKLIKKFSNVKYVALSNIENAIDIHRFRKLGFGIVKIIPKIETVTGIENSESIIDALNYHPAILMLDHQDLYSDLIKLNQEKYYLDMINGLIEVCRKKDAQLLRTIGIVFSTEEIK